MKKRKSTYTDIKQRKRENGKKQDKQYKEKKKGKKTSLSLVVQGFSFRSSAPVPLWSPVYW